MKENHVSIWFLIGLQLSIFGVLIVAAGLYGLYIPPEQATVLENLHPAIWWGGLMFVLGLFYTFKFWPSKKN